MQNEHQTINVKGGKDINRPYIYNIICFPTYLLWLLKGDNCEDKLSAVNKGRQE